MSDVVSALGAQGLDIEPERQPAHHPLLGIAGTMIRSGTTSIEVYVYPDLTSRVADQQVIQRYVMRVQSFMTDGGETLRVMSARNLLLLFQAESADHAALIYEAARTLSSVAGS
ncbi:MAG TPA: hypothetical protein VEX37_11030 [Thermomicrobiales bacterium]|nr:hypothetical protein [Thermomicrobiales bacterium]